MLWRRWKAFEWSSEEAITSAHSGEPRLGFEGVELESGGAAPRETEVAEHLALDALEDEARPRVAGRGRAPVVGPAIEALGHEADADQRIGRAALPPPEPTVLAGRAVVVAA